MSIHTAISFQRRSTDLGYLSLNAGEYSAIKSYALKKNQPIKCDFVMVSSR